MGDGMMVLRKADTTLDVSGHVDARRGREDLAGGRASS